MRLCFGVGSPASFGARAGDVGRYASLALGQPPEMDMRYELIPTATRSKIMTKRLILISATVIRAYPVNP